MNVIFKPKALRRLLSIFFVCAIIAANGQIAHAEEPLFGTKTTLDPRALGLAGALRALPSSTSGIYLNPATLAMANLYHMNMMYQFTSKENLHTGGLAIADSVTSSTFAAGLSLNYLGANQDTTHHESWDGRLALAGNFGDVFFAGMTCRYIRVANDVEPDDLGPGNMHPALPSSGSLQLNGFTFDAGAALKLGDMLSIGITGYNLSNTNSVYAPLKLGGGIGTTLFEMLLIEADLVVDFSSHNELSQEIDLGAEIFLAGLVPVRIGYIFDTYYQMNSIAAGIGYTDTAFALDVGFQYEIRNNGRFFLAFGLRIFLS